LSPPHTHYEHVWKERDRLGTRRAFEGGEQVRPCERSGGWRVSCSVRAARNTGPSGAHISDARIYRNCSAWPDVWGERAIVRSQRLKFRSLPRAPDQRFDSEVRGWREGCGGTGAADAGWPWGPGSSRASGVTGPRGTVDTRRCYMRLNRAAGWLGGDGGRRRGPQLRGSCLRVPELGRQAI